MARGPTPERAAPRPASPPRRALAVPGLMASTLLAALDQAIVATALPAIASDLGGLEHLSWVVTAYLLTSTAATPLWGRLGDAYGRGRVLQVAIAAFVLASALCGLARSAGQLAAFRALQGVGGGGLVGLAVAILGELVPPRERGRYQGYFAAALTLANVAGPLAGGLLTDHLSWRWGFYVNLPVGLAALWAVRAAPRPPAAAGRARGVDWPGAALLVAGTTCLLLVTVWGGSRYPWGSPRTVTLALAGAALLAAFTAWERRAAEPILPLRLFRDRTVGAALACAFCLGAAILSAAVYAPLFLQAVLGASATGSGLALVPLLGAGTLASLAVGRLITRTGRYKPFPLAGTALLALGYAWLSRLGEGTSRPLVSLAMAVTGAGMGMSMPVVTLAVQNAVGRGDLGAGTAAVQFFRTLGGAAGVALLGAVASARLPAGALPDLDAGPAGGGTLPGAATGASRAALASALSAAFLAAVPVAAAAFLASARILERPLRDAPGGEPAAPPGPRRPLTPRRAPAGARSTRAAGGWRAGCRPRRWRRPRGAG